MRRYLLILIVVLFHIQSPGQSNEELRAIFVEAESHYLFGEYELANPLYLILDGFMPGNANIKYKIGNCYLNIPDEKKLAIPYLEAAVGNASYEANAESFREQRAPLDSYFSLANAYRIENEFNKALNTYERLNELMLQNDKLVNADFIDQQISACRNALKFVETPVVFITEDLGPDINLGSINGSPAVSGDGNSMVFTEQRGLENAIFYIRKEFRRWGEPIEITHQLGDAKDCHSTCLNYDGTELYLYKNDNYDGNIYVSKYVNGSWSNISKLNRNINTRFYESHAAISTDGSRLYFTSNREGGEGNLDIYVSEKDDKGDWGQAVNLGSAVNTPFNEDTPFISINDSILYFSSEGHTNIGGYDIFETRKLGGVWKAPRNIGFPLNSPDDDLFFNPFNNGANAYFSMPAGYKEKHIYYITMGQADRVNRMFEIKGVVSLSDTVVKFNEDYRIILYSKIKEDTVDISFPNESSGYYSFLVRGDEYTLTYEGLAYLSVYKDVSLNDDHPTGEEEINVVLEPDENYMPEIPEIVEKLDFSQVQVVDAIDTSILVTDVILRDVSDLDSSNVDVLYYTIQLMALYNPVDVSFFRNTVVTVVYNDEDKFYRYTTGKFNTKDEAYRRRDALIRLGYPEDIFVKTVFSGNQ